MLAVSGTYFVAQDDDSEHIGFIAEDTQGIDSRFATDGDLPGIEMNAIVSALTAMVQEQQGAGQERDETFVPVNRIASTALVVLLVAVGIAIVVTILIARNITRPIQHLEEATETIGRTGALTQNIAVEGQDEVSHLATTFNS